MIVRKWEGGCPQPPRPQRTAALPRLPLVFCDNVILIYIPVLARAGGWRLATNANSRFSACVFDTDDLGRLCRNVAGGRLYAEPRTCRLRRRARRKPSSSRLRHFARRCTVSVRHLEGGARSFTLAAAFCSKPTVGAAQGRGDRRLTSARCRRQQVRCRG